MNLETIQIYDEEMGDYRDLAVTFEFDPAEPGNGLKESYSILEILDEDTGSILEPHEIKAEVIEALESLRREYEEDHQLAVAGL